MPAYIAPAEYAAWGLPAGAATDTLIIKASAMVDAFCHRAIGEKVYTERLSVAEGRNQARLTYAPFVAWDTADANNPTGLRARYGLGRRGDVYREPGLLEMTAAFGGPPAWTNITTAQVDIDPTTGAIWLPMGIYQSAWGEVEARYRAGYAVIPDAVKAAVAGLAQVLQAAPPGARMVKAGDRAIAFATPSAAGQQVSVPAETAALLAPYRVQALR